MSKLNRFIILFFLLSAFGIRLWHIDRPPLDFSPIRQYQNAHIARGLYFESNGSISETRKQIAKLNMERMGFILEPRIIENIAVIGYRIMGAEQLWIPRTISALFWVVGGLFLFLSSYLYFSFGISLFVTIFYLFLPYSILASRSIQPDPMMIMMMLISIYLVLKHNEKPSFMKLIIGALIASMAVIVKPYCVLIIFVTFFALAVHRQGFWRATFHFDTIAYGSLMILPALVYYLSKLLSGIGFLGVHVKSSFLPHLLIHPSFWNGWFDMIVTVVGYIAFFLSILGLVTAGRGKPRALLLGLWTGYLFFGLSATYQIHTHSYYHMPIIPIVALSLAPVACKIRPRIACLQSRRFLCSILAIVAVLLIIIGIAIQNIPLKDILAKYKDNLKLGAAVIGINPEFSKFLSDDFDNKIRIAKEIGAHVNHSTRTVFLTDDFGRVLAFHGEFAGLPWPTSRSLHERKLTGTPVPDISNDFTPQYIILMYQGKLVKFTPDYFIITAFDELTVQTDLKEYLVSNFPVLVSNNDYIIFDLRKMNQQNESA